MPPGNRRRPADHGPAGAALRRGDRLDRRRTIAPASTARKGLKHVPQGRRAGPRHRRATCPISSAPTAAAGTKVFGHGGARSEAERLGRAVPRRGAAAPGDPRDRRMRAGRSSLADPGGPQARAFIPRRRGGGARPSLAGETAPRREAPPASPSNSRRPASRAILADAAIPVPGTGSPPTARSPWRAPVPRRPAPCQAGRSRSGRSLDAEGPHPRHAPAPSRRHIVSLASRPSRSGAAGLRAGVRMRGWIGGAGEVFPPAGRVGSSKAGKRRPRPLDGSAKSSRRTRRKGHATRRRDPTRRARPAVRGSAGPRRGRWGFAGGD